MKLFKGKWSLSQRTIVTPGWVYCILVTVVGVAIIGIGSTVGSFWLVAVGGAVLGAGVSSLVTTYDTRRLLEKSLGSEFPSEDEELEPFRQVWHHYHVTEVDDVFVWRHYIINLSGTQAVGTLVSSVAFRDRQSKRRLYTVEAGVRDKRLILFMSAKDKAEPRVVEIFPQTAGFMDTLFGFGCLQSWDSTHVLHPCILSKVPLYESDEEGDVPAGEADKLDEQWRENFGSQNRILPRQGQNA
jgi:hypothetical protein